MRLNSKREINRSDFKILLNNKKRMSMKKVYTSVLRLTLSVFSLLLLFNYSYGATRYSVATGNWNATSTWSATSGGASGASFPVAGDVVIIENNFTVTVTANAACASVTINGSSTTNGTTQLVIGSSGTARTLTLTSDITINGGSTDARIAKLSFNTQAAHSITGAVNVTINGNGGVARAVIDGTGGTGSMALSGSFTNNSGTFTPGEECTINFNGTGAQTVPAYNYGNLTISGVRTSNSVTLASGTIGVARALTISATFTTGAIVNNADFSYNGSAAQTLLTSAALAYNNLTVSNSGATVTLGGNITTTNLTGNLTVQNGTLATGGFTITGNSGKTLAVQSGATLNISGTTVSFPTGFGTITLDNASTVNYSSTNTTQYVAARNYGNLTISGTKPVASDTVLAGTVGIAGTLSVTATYTAGSFVNNADFDFNGTTAQSVPIPATVVSFRYNNLIISNSSATVSLGNNITTTNLLGNLTIKTGAVFATNSNSIIGNTGKTLTVQSGATLSLSGTTTGFPTGFGTISLDNASTVDYAGTVAQSITAQTYGNLSSSSSGSRTLPASTVSLKGTFTPGTNTYTTTGNTIDYNNAGAQSIAGFAYNNLTISGSRGANNVTLSPTDTIFVGGTFSSTASFTSGAFVITGNTIKFNSSSSQAIPAFNYNNLYSSGGTRTLASSGTIGVAGTLSLAGATNTYTITGSTINFNGSGSQTIPVFNYNHLTSSSTGARTLAAGSIGISGTFTPGSNSYTVTGSTIDFNGTGNQTIPAFNYNNLTTSSTGGRTLATSGSIGIAGVFTAGATNSFTTVNSTVDFNGSGAQTIPAFDYGNLTSSSTGARTLAATDTIKITGTFTPGSNAYTITGSTINYNGSGSQTIAAFNYNNLYSSSSGARTLASSGTIGIAGVLSKGTNTYTITGSTIDYNGTGAQTVIAMNYNNLTISGSRTANSVTLASSGTIGIAGALTSTATFSVGSLVNTGSTIDYNGSGAQTIAAFNYNNLTSSSSGSRTLASSGTIGIGGTFTPGSNTYTNTGSTIDYNGTGAQTVKAFNYNNLTISGSRTTNSVTLASSGNIGISGNLNVSATFASGSLVTTNSNVEFNGSGTQTVSGGGLGSTTTPFNILTVNNSGSTSTTGLQQPSTGLSTKTLTLTAGRLLLNGKTLIITDSTASGITRTAGFIVCEDSTQTAKVQWAVNKTTTGDFVFPFGTSANSPEYVPVTFHNNTSATSQGNVSVNTYHTIANNTPFPTGVSSLPTTSDLVVDRFWRINISTTGTHNADFTFSCTSTEGSGIIDLDARRWSGSSWAAAPAGQTNPSSYSVKVPGLTTSTSINGPWTLEGSPSLPISLLSFTGTKSGKNIQLKWATATEINNDHFEIERADGNSTFNAIGTVSGAGNSNELRTYSFLDEHPYQGIAYYRLMQVDRNGSVSYSGIISMALDKKGLALEMVYPNPTSDQVALNITSDSEVPAQLFVSDITGKIVKQLTVPTQKGLVVFYMDLSDIAKGIYYIRLEQAGNSASIKIEKN